MSKVLKKVVTNRIASATEKRELIPWNQTSVRGGRSTLSAIKILTGTIQIAWAARHPVISVLTLDLARAFDSVSHVRLL